MHGYGVYKKSLERHIKNPRKRLVFTIYFK